MARNLQAPALMVLALDNADSASAYPPASSTPAFARRWPPTPRGPRHADSDTRKAQAMPHDLAMRKSNNESASAKAFALQRNHTVRAGPAQAWSLGGGRRREAARRDMLKSNCPRPVPKEEARFVAADVCAIWQIRLARYRVQKCITRTLEPLYKSLSPTSVLDLNSTSGIERLSCPPLVLNHRQPDPGVGLISALSSAGWQARKRCSRSFNASPIDL